MTAEPIGGYTIDEQIKCVSEELATRKMACAHWVSCGRLAVTAADYVIGCMQAVLDTLVAVKEGMDQR
jgi:hypothetical protein